MKALFFIRSRMRLVAAASAVAMAFLPLIGHASPSDEVAAAATDLYARISARDLSGMSQYVPSDGFSEIGVGAGAVHRLDLKAFEGLFNAPVDIDLRAVSVEAQVYGDTAVVTGRRVGAITPKGKPAVQGANPFTAVWLRTSGHWQLRHIHLSAISQ